MPSKFHGVQLHTASSYQVAVAKGLVSAAQHRRRQRPIVLTVHNVTTARDLQPPQATHPRRRVAPTAGA